MKDLLDYIAKNLVTKPESVSVSESKQDGNVDLILTVDPEDMGLIIGKGGATIRAIRKVLTVRAIAENVRVNLQLSEPEGGAPKENKEATSEDIEESSEIPEEVVEETPQESEPEK